MNPIFDAIFDNGMIEFPMFGCEKIYGYWGGDHTDRFSMPHKNGWMSHGMSLCSF